MLRPRTTVTPRAGHGEFAAWRAACALAWMLAVAPLHAGSAGEPQQSAQPEDDSALRFRLPAVIVTAQKEPEDRQKVPVSVTAVSAGTIASAAIHEVSDAAIFAPNTFFTESSARRLSVARFRGIASSPNNPGITTYIDGVPQLNESSANLELLDVDQIEFVRGPQGALFGRNTLGGLVNITSTRPSLSEWTRTLSVPFGNHGAWAIRAGAAGPLSPGKASLGVSFAQVDRSGFTVNDLTGNDIDRRSAFSAKAQLLLVPTSAWEGRVIVTAERARDGDYALGDVALLRANPFHAARDFEGRTDRSVLGTTFVARRSGERVAFSSTTGLLAWDTRDVTDLDYTPQPILTRDNLEQDFQFTQEVRLASAEAAPVRLGDRAILNWQTGVFLFTQRYDQDAINRLAPFVAAPFPVAQHAPRSALDDAGVGVFGQGIVTLHDKVDLAAGVRVDYEGKTATLETFFDPLIAPSARVEAEAGFTNVSPQFSVSYRLQPEHTLYAVAGRGYKAGGFNPASPAGLETYGEEHTWHLEGGVKTLFADGRVSGNAAAFYIDWSDLQLNVPNPAIPAQFYIANVGGAVSKGIEVETGARLAPGLDLIAAAGYTHARFTSSRSATGAALAGNTIPNTPAYTATVGLQYSRPVGPTTLEWRVDAVRYGAFQYDDANTLGQEAFSLVNARLAVIGRGLLCELIIRNAFDTRYIPLAFPYPGFAPSGFVGEMGPPRTTTIGVGVRF